MPKSMARRKLEKEALRALNTAQSRNALGDVLSQARAATVKRMIPITSDSDLREMIRAVNNSIRSGVSVNFKLGPQVR
jgi:5-formyltetrahydrofolate cyclo-ligase